MKEQHWEILSNDVVSGVRSELAHARFRDGSPRTLRIRPINRRAAYVQSGLVTGVSGFAWLLKVEIQEKLGPVWSSRFQYVPWTGAAILLGGGEARVFATLEADDVQISVDSTGVDLSAAVSVELSLRDGAPIPFSCVGGVELLDTAESDFCDIPPFVDVFTPRFPRQSVAGCRFREYDSLDQIVCSYVAQNASAANTLTVGERIPLGPQADRLTVEQTNGTAAGTVFGFHFEGYC